jgi:hypothetical protein
MKRIKVLALLLSSIVFFYCNGPSDKKQSDEVLNDSTIYESETDVAGSFETPEEQTQTSTENNIGSTSKSETEKKQEPKTSEDIDELIKAGINTNKNPDNYSGKWDEELDKNRYVPIISEADKKLYRIQIFVSPNKLPNQKLQKEYPFLDTIYVVYHEGLYKYSVGKYSNKDEAENQAKILKGKGIKEYKVTNYSTAW